MGVFTEPMVPSDDHPAVGALLLETKSGGGDASSHRTPLGSGSGGYSGRSWGGRYVYLLVSLLLLLVVHPFAPSELLAELTLDICLLMIFASGVYAVAQKRHAWVTSTVLAVPALVGRSVHWSTDVEVYMFEGLFLAMGGLFFFVNAMFVLANVMRQREVTASTIYGALSVYILIGLTFGTAFALVEMLQPGSFLLPTLGTSPVVAARWQLVSFSFVTLTTVGYGDIVPITPGARGLCNLEALLGQIYLTVLVARLVGIHISQTGTLESD